MIKIYPELLPLASVRSATVVATTTRSTFVYLRPVRTARTGCVRDRNTVPTFSLKNSYASALTSLKMLKGTLGSLALIFLFKSYASENAPAVN